MCPLCQALLQALGVGDIADKRPCPNGARDDRVLPASLAPPYSARPAPSLRACSLRCCFMMPMPSGTQGWADWEKVNCWMKVGRSSQLLLNLGISKQTFGLA